MRYGLPLTPSQQLNPPLSVTLPIVATLLCRIGVTARDLATVLAAQHSGFDIELRSTVKKNKLASLVLVLPQQ